MSTIQPNSVWPSRPTLGGLSAFQSLILLIVLIYLPLVAYVMFANQLGSARSYVLLPAIPAVVILYAMSLRNWREMPIALIGATLRILLAHDGRSGAIPSPAGSQ